MQGGKPIIEPELVAKKLFDAYMAIESTRALLWKGSWHTSTSFPGDLKTSVTAKILATQNAVEHTTAMVQVLGGYGITRDYKLEKCSRRARPGGTPSPSSTSHCRACAHARMGSRCTPAPRCMKTTAKVSRDWRVTACAPRCRSSV